MTDPGSPGGFLQNLRQRKLLAWLVAYAAGAWVALQVLGLMADSFEWPRAVMRIGFGVAMTGLALAVVLAWYHGERGVQRGTRVEAILLAIVLAVGGAASWRLARAPEVPATTSAGPAVQSGSGDTATAPTPAAPPRSIAVLPFENLSADPENAFFAVGIQDEILTGLSRIDGLKVISRTSTLRYESKPANLTEIGRELGVANILEGSVQKAGNRVRVNVQLIDARDDHHLWADTYDRELQDVFAVQSEVAKRIAGSLEATLTQEVRASLDTRPTSNTEAYEHYLKARATILQTSSYDRTAVNASIEELKTAVRLDPGFALAWGELSQQHVWTYFTGFDSTPARLELGNAALQRAEALAPGNPQVAMWRSIYLYYGLHDFPGALEVIRSAQRGLPGDARVWYVSALLGRRLGQWEASNADFEHARTLSPNDYSVVSELAYSLFRQREYERALPLIDASLALQREDPAMLALKLNCLWTLEGLAAGGRMLDAITSESPSVLAMRGTQALYERDVPRATQLFTRAVEAGDNETILPSTLAGYIPAINEWQLWLADIERVGDPTGAAKRYRAQLDKADAELAKSGTPYVESSWRQVRAWSLAGLGQAEEAAAEGLRAMALVPEASDALEGPSLADYQARIYAMNGDAARAIPLIEHQLSIKGSLLMPVLLELDPVWDTIRDDPRFKVPDRRPTRGSETMSGIFAELKRRNVVRMAVLYLVGAWLAVQVAETVLPIFGTPVWVLQALVVLLVLGLVPALVFSWIYELTPQGLKRDAEVPPEQSIAPQTARRMDRMIIAFLVLALCYFGVDKFVLAPARDAARNAAPAASAVAAVAAPATTALPAAAAPAVDSKSIAVLPFADLSPERDQEYFSDGMAEEILDALAKIGDLKVAGRTSSFYFKDKNETLQTIGEALGVANVLEGSVRKQGEKVRITAQLVQTRDGFHLWSETYDGDLSDVFKLQERIALAIAGELKLVLHAGQQAQLAEQATESGIAHQHVLRGRYLFNRRGLRSLQTAAEAFKSALAIDPQYEDAWAGLAQTYAVLPEYAAFDPEGEGKLIDTFPDALDAAEHALRLDPASSRALSARAYVRCVNQFDWAGAEADYRAAVASNPRDFMVRQWYGELLFYQHRFPEAFAQYEAALAEDPLSAITHFSMGLALWYADEPERALEALRESLRLSPDMYFARIYVPLILLELGRHDEALEATSNTPEDKRAMLKAIIVSVRDGSGNDEAVRLVVDHGPGGVVGKPVLLAFLGRHDLAMDELERLFAARDPMREFLYAIPQFKPLYGDPRFQALLKQIGLPRASNSR